MKSSSDLLSFEILPLSEVKATFSEQVKKTQQQGKRIAVTTNGKPTAVLLSYEDFLNLLKSAAALAARPAVATRVIRYEDWKREDDYRRRARDSIVNLFDVDQMTRKGQKTYKKDLVSEFDRNDQKGVGRGRKNR